MDGAGEAEKVARLRLLDDWHDQAPFKRHGNAQVDVVVVVDRTVDQRRVEDGEPAQRIHGGGGNKGHISQLDAVALLKAGPLPLAQAGDAGHVHLVDGVDMWADPLAL